MDLPAQISTALTSLSLPAPSQTWLQTIISARTPPAPLPSLIATAKTRLLAADLTSPGLLAPTAAGLPASIANAAVQEARLPRDVVLQVLDVENLSSSRWQQVEELEAIERGEQTKGREVIRLPTGGPGQEEGGEAADAAPEDRPAGAAAAQGGAGSRSSSRGGGGSGGGGAGKNATHKLLLQDCKGQTVSGLELRRIERVDVGKLNIGEKLLIKGGAVVARGVILLEPANCRSVGGKVDAWHKKWLDGRLARLREAVGATDGRPGQASSAHANS